MYAKESEVTSSPPMFVSKYKFAKVVALEKSNTAPVGDLF
jgi:hypothetical protein